MAEHTALAAAPRAAVRRAPSPGGRRGRGRGRERGLTFTAMLAPSLILVGLINAYPLVYGAIESTHAGTLIAGGPYVGIDNYTQVLSDPRFWAAARFTALFTVVGVLGSWAVGLGLALLLRSDVPGRSYFRVLLLLPWVVPVVVSSMSWIWLSNTYDSPLPTLARALGFGDVLFLSDPTLAVVTVFAFKIWISFPFMMMTSGASLEAVDHTLYEAASVDGASKFQQFVHITLPMIAKTTFVSWVLMTIFCVNDFPTIFLLTGGGPVDATTSLIVYAYRLTFQNFQLGPGLAVALLMTAALTVVSVILYRQIRRAQ
ncbi:carbohydrate ABC transporter permease [Cryptosporangium aurantiacum]|uniref:Carbohydrate ABC transporter membrane protein 1, CUT1 family n=1 Tax=Cryptosporangium aurantiacum TaxID=134849 RepID=A0A1M7R3I3_9ACTN|nr:sugar ABC transporter permease [Cryptosporangium aurantiacum]SHN39527.1 carbohydrate ABC transporter membrane protein 1, CUT1 family [Cryptosporangium aurantiacum]